MTEVTLTFSVRGGGEINEQEGPYTLGGHVYIQAKPFAGWRFSHFLRNGVEVTPHENPKTFWNLDEDESFIAVFEQTTVASRVTPSARPATVTPMAFDTNTMIMVAVVGGAILLGAVYFLRRK